MVGLVGGGGRPEEDKGLTEVLTNVCPCRFDGRPAADSHWSDEPPAGFAKEINTAITQWEDKI